MCDILNGKPQVTLISWEIMVYSFFRKVKGVDFCPADPQLLSVVLGQRYIL